MMSKASIKTEPYKSKKITTSLVCVGVLPIDLYASQNEQDTDLGTI
jgi:hypothetical protein